MKVVFGLVALVAVAMAGSVVPPEVQQQFREWMIEQKRSYASEAELQSRMGNFYNNLLQVAELNKAESHSSTGAHFRLNKFADWSAAELKSLRNFRGNPTTKNGTAPLGRMSRAQIMAAPTSVDWRTKGVLAPVQDQGQCGSCWAFSATSNIETQNAMKSGSVTKLAEQALVDCDHDCGSYRFMDACDSGCNGGLQPNAFKWAIANGMPSEDSYPYRAQDGSCQHPSAVSHISGWEFAPEDETELAAYVATNGPVSVAVDAAHWSFYDGGIMKSASVCPDVTSPPFDLDHGVNIVGYGEESGTKYWIIRNSWAADWGENGYCRILRGKGTSLQQPGFCGINTFACNSKV